MVNKALHFLWHFLIQLAYTNAEDFLQLNAVWPVLALWPEQALSMSLTESCGSCMFAGKRANVPPLGSKFLYFSDGLFLIQEIRVAISRCPMFTTCFAVLFLTYWYPSQFMHLCPIYCTGVHWSSKSHFYWEVGTFLDKCTLIWIRKLPAPPWLCSNQGLK